MKKIIILLVLSLCGSLSFAQSNTGKEAVGRSFFNGQVPDLIPKSAVQKGIKQTSVETTHEQEEQHADGHQHEDGEPCGTVEYNKQLRQRNPKMSSDAEFEAFLQQLSPKNIARSSGVKKNALGETVYQLPIVVHVVYYPGEAIGTGHNLSKEAIYAQIDVLNEDYRRKGSTRGYNNLPAGADTKIEFVKALYDAQGKLLPEAGIHRINASTITDGVSYLNLSNAFFSQATAEWIKERTFWEPNCYINVWVMGISKPLLGFSTFPEVDLVGIAGYDLDHMASHDGVVVDYRRFGTNERGPFSQIEADSYGRTPTHELGHFLGLRHTFGDAPSNAYGQRPSGCNYDDYVGDTPNQKDEMRGGIPLYLCDTREMVENYMGYSPEQGMNIFTQGQVERMHKVLENSPRRKELLTSTVANASGEKTPVVTIKASATELYVLDLFSFEAYVERFPGTYSWTFEDGVPATSTDRNPGVYFTSSGVKQVTLTVDNIHSTVTKKMSVEVKSVQSCTPQYASTIKTLERFYGSAIAPGNYVTGHANVWGYKMLGNRFTRSNDPDMKAISQVEMEISRFYINEAIGHYNPDTLVKFFIMAETYDSLRMNKIGTNNFKLFKPGAALPHTQYTLSKGEVDTLAMGYKITPEVVPSWREEKIGTDTFFIARKIRPGDTLATIHIRVGDIQKAFESVSGKLIAKLDNPVWPTTENYFIVLDLDYDYYSTYRRPYSFEFNAVFSPINFAWVYSTITIQNAAIDPLKSTYIQEWKPFSEPMYANSWGTAGLLALLPVYTSDTTAIPRPELRLSADTVAVGQKMTAYVDGAKPSNLNGLRWAVIKEDDTRYTLANKDSVSYTFNAPGRYNITLTYEDQTCLQRSTTKQIVVKGIRFRLENTTMGGAFRTCDNATTNATMSNAALKVVEIFKSGTAITYTWMGDDVVNNTTGLAKTVTPKITRTYYVTATDNNDPSISTRDSITVEVNRLKPEALFDVTYPHLRRGDTLDLYVTDASKFFTTVNNSKNVSALSSGKFLPAVYWYIEKPSAALFSTQLATTWDIKSAIGGMLSSGPGIYRLSLRAGNQLCAAGALAPAATTDTAIVYLNILAAQDFGALQIHGNETPLALGSTPPGYENSRGSYYMYVPTGGNVTLKAASNEIKSIKWTNTYNETTSSTNTIEVSSVRDVARITLNVTRQRSNGQSTIDFNEDLVVILYPESYKPKQLAVASFTITADSICVGNTIKFENTTANAVDFKWEFDGGELVPDVAEYGYETLWKPTRIYKQGGAFTAKLTVTSYDGSTSTRERTVYVVPANNPRMVYAATTSLGSIRNDTIFAPSGKAVGVGISGYGIKGLYTLAPLTGVRVETYKTTTSLWQWTNHAASSIKGMVANITYRENLTDTSNLSRLPRVALDVLGCNGTTRIVDTLYVKLVPVLIMDYYNLDVNGQALQLGDQKTLPNQLLCPGQALNMELKCTNAEAKATTDVMWYEVDANEIGTLVGTGYTFSIVPTKNTNFWVRATNKLRQTFTYSLPVMIGATASNLQVMNQDLVLKGDTLKLPIDYNTDIIVRANGLNNPQWRKLGNPTILSDNGALVIVTPEEDTLTYEVSSVSPIGGCTYTTQLTIVKPVQNTGVVDPGDTSTEDDTKAIDMYPIPARDVLNINSPYDGEAYIVNGSGQVVKQFQLKAGPMTLPLYGMAAGVYRLVVQQAKEGKIISRNFVVVR